MTKKHIYLVLVAAVLSCSPPEVEPEDENELITTIKLNFSANGLTETFVFQDLDGDGGKNPIRFDEIGLRANTAYQVEVQVLDESQNPVVDITNEVKDEQQDHLFVYTPTPSNLLMYSYADKDLNGLPVGILGNVKTGNSGVGTIKVQLRHQPDGTKDGSAAPGSDDINLDFSVKVQ